MIVLGYIKNVSRWFKTFVGNRLGVIHDATSPDQWRYVSMPTHISVWGYMYPRVFPFGGTCSFLRVHIF